METLIIRCKRVVKGKGCGEALVSREPISFVGSIDKDSGVIVERGHELEGESIVGKVLVFPHGKGSTAGSYIIYSLAKRKKAPAAIINIKAEPIIITGAAMAGIPLVHKLEKNPTKVIRTGDYVIVDAYNEIVQVKKKIP